MITIKNGIFGYNKPSVLENVEINIKKGDLVALVGENGSGKSTILKTLAGIIPLQGGQIFINNQNYDSYSLKELATQISIVLSTQPFIPNIKVKDLIGLTSKVSFNKNEIKVTEKKAMEWLQITDIQNKYCTSLSDGQLQRVFIARALAQDTPIILFDEPSSHLDINHKYNLYNLFIHLTQKLDKTILFSTHDLKNVSEFICNFIAIKQNKLSIEASVSEDFFLAENSSICKSFE